MQLSGRNFWAYIPAGGKIEIIAESNPRFMQVCVGGAVVTVENQILQASPLDPDTGMVKR